MFTIAVFAITLGILILVHELGHFIMAKRAGMKVEEFGFGFPPRLFGIKRGETIYSINWIPFGGFVKILGEDGADKDNPRSFASKGFWPRFNTLVAGVTMNFILAVFLMMFVGFVGLRVGIFDEKTAEIALDKRIQVISVSESSPAQASDIRVLDEISSLVGPDGVKVEPKNITEIQSFTSQNSGKTVTINIKRGNEEVAKMISLKANVAEGEGSLGVSLAQTGLISYPWYEAIWRGVYNSIIMAINVVIGYFYLFKTLIFEGRLMGEVSGPVGIAKITGQAARIGTSYLMQFIALISINLAVLNILPFPALDGGRVLFLFIEKIKGSPIKKEIEGWVNATGFALLIALMVYVTFKDVIKFF